MNNLEALRLDCIIKQKRGVHFIITSVFSLGWDFFSTIIFNANSY